MRFRGFDEHCHTKQNNLFTERFVFLLYFYHYHYACFFKYEEIIFFIFEKTCSGLQIGRSDFYEDGIQKLFVRYVIVLIYGDCRVEK